METTKKTINQGDAWLLEQQVDINNTGKPVEIAKLKNSNIPAVAVVQDNHTDCTHYSFSNVLIFDESNTTYMPGQQSLTFKSEINNDVIVPGVTEKQVALALYDRLQKMNAYTPVANYEELNKALNDYLKALK